MRSSHGAHTALTLAIDSHSRPDSHPDSFLAVLPKGFKCNRETAWHHLSAWCRVRTHHEATPLCRRAHVSLSAVWRQDSLIVQLVVTFVRNLLAVADVRRVTGSGKGDHKTRLRQELLGRLFDEDVMELLLTVAQHTDEARAPFQRHMLYI